MTQPDQVRSRISKKFESFSQPLSDGQAEIDSNESSNIFVRNNFARFLCRGSVQKVSDRLIEVLHSMLVPFQISNTSQYQNNFHFQTVDRRKCPLVGQISLQVLADSVLVIVKKNRGNPIEYVRFFKFIVENFMDLI